MLNVGATLLLAGLGGFAFGTRAGRARAATAKELLEDVSEAAGFAIKILDGDVGAGFPGAIDAAGSAPAADAFKGVRS
jgi:hypothetical protein